MVLKFEMVYFTKNFRIAKKYEICLFAIGKVVHKVVTVSSMDFVCLSLKVSDIIGEKLSKIVC
jgi:hypothetical protein